MIVTFLSVNGLLFFVFCFCPPTIKRKRLFTLIFKASFFQSFQRLHFPRNLASELFFLKEGIPARNLFVIYGDSMIYNVAYFVRQVTIIAIRCGHTGQTKPSTREKVERLEKLKRIEGSRLQMQASEMWEKDRCH